MLFFLDLGRWRWGILMVLAAGSACQSQQAKECGAEYERAQHTVLEVDAGSIDSVSESLAAIEHAVELCQKAQRHGEVDQLVRARNQFSAQLTALEKRAARPPRNRPSPEELAVLERKGDPSCPKGQAYKHRGVGKEIRCTGPQFVEMSPKLVKEYFGARNYSIRPGDAPPSLSVEFGAELLVFQYASLDADAPPSCVKLYPPPGMNWQEVTARATGVPPQKLKPDAPVRTPRGELALRVEDSEQKVLVQLGNCPSQ